MLKTHTHILVALTLLKNKKKQQKYNKLNKNYFFILKGETIYTYRRREERSIFLDEECILILIYIYILLHTKKTRVPIRPRDLLIFSLVSSSYIYN